MSLSRRIVTTIAVLGTTITLGACTSAPAVVGSTVSMPSPTQTGSHSPTKAPAVTAQPQQGMLTGPGVSDASISLGLIVDAATDRGFTDGVRLWRDTINTTGGICGRTIQLATAAAGSAPDVSYETVGRSTLGLITMEPGAAGMALASRIRVDRIPAFTPEGMSSKSSEPGPPIVLGATDDILAINTAAHLLTTGVVPAGGTLGVLVDDSAAAADVMDGLTWWADKNKVTLRAISETGSVPADIPAVFAAVGPAQVASLLSRTSSAGGSVVSGGPATSGAAATAGGDIPGGTTASNAPVGASTRASGGAGGGSGSGGRAGSGVGTSGGAASVSGSSAGAGAGDGAASSPTGPIIATTLDGFDPSLLPAGQAGRLLVATVTPSPGADHPGVKAVDAAYAAAGQHHPGPRLLEGYATGEIWARLLEPMCSARTLTRTAALADLARLAPSSPDSLFGSTNPNAALTTGAPASRVSALSIADSAAPAGLRPVTLLESAPGIADYHPG